MRSAPSRRITSPLSAMFSMMLAASFANSSGLPSRRGNGMLAASEYPNWLKERISGPFGHLDNGQSHDLLASLDRSRLKHVIGALAVYWAMLAMHRPAQ